MKNLKKLGKILMKSEQKSILGGGKPGSGGGCCNPANDCCTTWGMNCPHWGNTNCQYAYADPNYIQHPYYTCCI